MVSCFKNPSPGGYSLISWMKDVKGREQAGKTHARGPIDLGGGEHFQIQTTFVYEQGENKPSR